MKKLNINKEKVNKFYRGVKILLFIMMIILIYLVSPKITQVIQDLAKYLYELDSTYITRVVELILSITFVVAAFTSKKKDK